MKFTHLLALILTVIIVLVSCSVKDPPVDNNGKTPQQVLMETYALIVGGKFEKAKNNFSSKYLKLINTQYKQTFVEYCSKTKGWKVEWLKTIVKGNDYNKKLWQVSIIPDEGKGAHNRPGISHYLSIIDGAWMIVFWGDYPKS